jgi:hypothetical protein
MTDRTKLGGLLALSLGLWLAACGGSDSKQNATSGSHAGAGGSSGPTLTDAVVGKACKSNTDCGNGLCANSFGANGLMGVMGTPAPGGYCTNTCASNTDCGSTGVCVGAFAGIPGFAGGGAGGATRGQCYLACATSDECREGYRCTNFLGMPVAAASGAAGAAASGAAGAATGASGARAGMGGRGATTAGVNALQANSCQPAPPTDKLTGKTVGSMCSADADCGGGQCMTTGTFGTNAFPQGYCTGRCLKDSDCGDGVCNAGLLGAAGTCYRRCGTDSDCARDGYRCRASAAMGGAMECLPGPKPLADGLVGKACTGDQDCGGVAMACNLSMSNPGGYCTQRCADASDCGAGGVCVGGFGAIGGAAPSGTCYKGCSAISDCREGYTCGSPRGAFGGTMQMVCTQPPMMRPPPSEDAGVP